MRASFLAPALICILYLSACGTSAPASRDEGLHDPPTAQVTLPRELARVLEDYERAWVSGDDAAMRALFTSDGLSLAPGDPPRAASAAFPGTTPGRSRVGLHLVPVAFAMGDSVGYIVGEFGTKRSGKFLLALRRGAGDRWLIAADMDNDNGQ